MFSQKMPYAKVGILGGHSGRNDGDLSNADVALIHEFGVPDNNIPERSILRVPLMDQMPGRVANMTIDKTDTIDLDAIIYKVGAIGKAVVQEGFTNNGYGKWPPSQKVVRNLAKGAWKQFAGDTLVDTGQLRDSIDFEVVKQ